MELMRVVQAVASNPVVHSVARRGFELRDSIVRAQSAAMEAMNLPTASDISSLAARLRSISTRLELMEDAIARVDHNVAQLHAGPSSTSD